MQNMEDLRRLDQLKQEQKRRDARATNAKGLTTAFFIIIMALVLINGGSLNPAAALDGFIGGIMVSFYIPIGEKK